MHTPPLTRRPPPPPPRVPAAATTLSRMIVICLEGCHGSGKSSLCGHFAAAGYSVLDEAFLDMPEYALHPQSLLMETTWVCAWFERILRRAAEDKKKDQPDEVFIADRSPFSAVFYAAKGFLLKEVIKEQMAEVLSQGGIEIHTVLVKVSVPCLLALRPLPRARTQAHPPPPPSLPPSRWTPRSCGSASRRASVGSRSASATTRARSSGCRRRSTSTTTSSGTRR